MFYFKILCEIFKNLFYLFKLNKILNFNSNPDMSNDLNTDYIQRFFINIINLLIYLNLIYQIISNLFSKLDQVDL